MQGNSGLGWTCSGEIESSAYQRICEYFGRSSELEEVDTIRVGVERQVLSANSSHMEASRDRFNGQKMQLQAPEIPLSNHEDRQVTVDTLFISWKNQFLYIFPPVPLIPQVLKKIIAEKPSVILLTLFLPCKAWFQVLLLISGASFGNFHFIGI